jgi:hypothetical protein
METSATRPSSTRRSDALLSPAIRQPADEPAEPVIAPRASSDTAKAYRGASTTSAGRTQRIAKAAAKNVGGGPAPQTSPISALAHSAEIRADAADAASTAATCAAPSYAPGDVALVKACRAHGVSQGDARALMNFVRQNSVDSAGVASAMNNAKQHPLEAAKAYAVLDDAIRTKLSLANAARLRVSAEAIRAGKVAMEPRDD